VNVLAKEVARRPTGYASALRRVLAAERLKLRGTLALWMCLVAPALVVTVVVLQLLVSTQRGPPLSPTDAWERLSLGVLGLWAFLMVPLYITLQAALLAALEHGSHQWRRLLALPIPRSAHYMSKLLALATMMLAAQVLITVLIPLGGLVLMAFKPRFGIAGAPPWTLLLTTSAGTFVATWLLLALHTWLALRWQSFAVACGVGMGATVMGFLIGQSADFGPWYPWSLPMQMLSSSESKGTVLALSALGGLLVTALGAWNFARRDHD